jgi:acyl dehydratase
MPINPDAAGHRDEPVVSSWTSKDCLLYALGVGAGASDPLGDLAFTTENSAGVTQQVLPTFPVVIPSTKGWRQVIGEFDPARLVHGEQSVELHQALPVEGSAAVSCEVTGVYDKGSGAVVATATTAVDATTGAALYTTTSSVFVRGEGGWGGDRGPSGRVSLPEREPDSTLVEPTRPDQALIYRLSGDRNPLHTDPTFAARGGFDRPILHGLCTFGFTGRALLHARCDSDPARFLALSGRFSQPVWPGETLTIRVWDLEPGRAAYSTSTPNGVVVDGGELRFKAD